MANTLEDWRTFDGPAKYQIRVQGRLLANWSERLGGMTVSPASLGAGSPETLLLGELSDQGALLGVLNTLYWLHLPVLLVERLPAVHEE